MVKIEKQYDTLQELGLGMYFLCDSGQGKARFFHILFADHIFHQELSRAPITSQHSPALRAGSLDLHARGKRLRTGCMDWMSESTQVVYSLATLDRMFTRSFKEGAAEEI